MIIRICYFTKQGQRLTERLQSERPDLICEVRNRDVPIEKWIKESFERRLPVVFIGAVGIAVRMIAPFVKDKLMDSAVIVSDEQGKFVIPLLSGHMGGANELAVDLSDTLQAMPVLTTATDVEKVFSVDVFARKNHLHVVNREGIRFISAKRLRGETIHIAIDSEIDVLDRKLPEGVEIVTTEDMAEVSGADVVIRRAPKNQKETREEEELQTAGKLILETKEYVLGMGCRKDKDYSKIMTFLQEHGVCGLEDSLYALASVDQKKNERGLIGAAQYFRIPFITYSAEELERVEGQFAESDFVRNTVGVSNVCERAAVCCAGEGAELVMKKTAGDGITCALARKKPEITTWET